MNTPIGQSTLGELLPYLLGIAFALIFVFSAFCMAIKTSKERKQLKLKKAQLVRSKDATLYANFLHVIGLPISENTPCDVVSCPGIIEISANGIEFKLDKSKILDISLKTDVEIQKQYVSSGGAAVGGALLFGPLGALIGGRVKAKKSETLHTYMLISYTKKDSVDYIAFDCTKNALNTKSFIDEFRETTNNVLKTIEL